MSDSLSQKCKHLEKENLKLEEANFRLRKQKLKLEKENIDLREKAAKFESDKAEFAKMIDDVRKENSGI